MFIKKRYQQFTKKPTQQNKPKFVIKEYDPPYTFDKFGKPIMKRWRPNYIQKLDDFGDINYNTAYINYV